MSAAAGEDWLGVRDDGDASTITFGSCRTVEAETREREPETGDDLGSADRPKMLLAELAREA
jgi:hypothetical protein